MLQFTVIGNLGADAEIAEYNERKYSTFRVATSRKVGEKEETTWVSVRTFYSEKLHPYLVKGQQVYVSGDGRLNVFTKKDGTVDAGLSIMASIIQLCGGKNVERQQTRSAVPNAQPAPLNMQPTTGESDLPFD